MKKILLIVILVGMFPMAAIAEEWCEVLRTDTNRYMIDLSGFKQEGKMLYFWVKNINEVDSIIAFKVSFESVNCDVRKTVTVLENAYYVGGRLTKTSDDATVINIEKDSPQEKIVDYACQYYSDTYQQE